MNNFYKIIGLLFLGSSMCAACKKDPKEQPLSFPLNFYEQKIELRSGIRLFTRDGEIMDAKKVEKFAENKNYFPIINSETDQSEPLFTLSSADSASFTIGDKKMSFSIAKAGNRFLFTAAQFMVTPSNSNDPTRNLFKYQTISNSGMFDLFKPIQLAYGDFKTLALPIQVYYIARRNQAGYQISSGMANNEINEAFIPTLKDQDTLAYKTYHIICHTK